MLPEERTEESPVEEFKDEIVGRWVKLRNYWLDRRKILAQPLLALAIPRRLTNKPLSFAMQSLVVVPLLIGIFQPIGDFLFDLPGTPAERELQKYERALKWTEDALSAKTQWPPVPDEIPFEIGIQLVGLPLYQRTPAADPVLARLRDDLKKVIRARRAIARTESAMDALRTPILGLGLIVNSYLFRFLLRRMRPEAGFQERAHVFHLYFVSARLFWPTTFLAVALAVFAFADRFTGNSPIGPPLLLYSIAGIWGLVLLRRSRLAFAEAFPPVLAEFEQRRWGTRVINRLIFSNLGTSAIAMITLTALMWGLLQIAIHRIP